MSTSIRKFVQGGDVSVETFGLEDFTDGEQKLDVHVSPEASVDEVVAEVAEAEVTQREIARDCDTAMQAKTALESYVDMMEKSLDSGGLSGDTYEPIRIGFENFGVSLGLEESENLPARGDFGGSTSRQEATKKAIGRGAGMIKKAWEVIKRILSALGNAIKDVMAKATFAARRLEKRCGELAAEAGRMNTHVLESDKKTLDLKGADKLFGDGRFMGDSFQTVSGFAKMVTGGLTDSAIKYMTDVASRVRGLDPSKEISPVEIIFVLGIYEMVERLDGMNQVTEQRFPKDATVVRGPILPGDKALYMLYPSGADKKGRVQRLGTMFRMELMPLPNPKKMGANEQITVKSVGVLKSQLVEAAKIANMVSKTGNRVTAFENAVKQLKEAGDALEAKAAKAEMSSVTANTVKVLLTNIGIVQKSKSGISGGLAHIITTTNAMVSLIERQMAQYSSPRLASPTSTNAPATT